MANEYIRKQSVGGAAQTTTTGAIDDNDTSIGIDSATGWPSGIVPFVVTIDPNEASEETMLVTRSGTTLTVVERGYDDTLAQAHSSGANIIHTFDAHSADQANRYVNLQDTLGALVIFNGTNPVQFNPDFAGDGSDDDWVLLADESAETGWRFGVLPSVVISASAPNVASTKYRLWYDTVLRQIRVSDGAAWDLVNAVPAFSSKAARAAAITAPRAGQLAVLQSASLIVLEQYDDHNNLWKPVGIPSFAAESDRDAYYTDQLFEGAQALTLDTDSQWSYRAAEDEWILQGQKITISATQPADPRDGDVWLQPLE